VIFDEVTAVLKAMERPTGIPETLDAGPISLQRWTVGRAVDLYRAASDSMPELIPFMPWATADYNLDGAVDYLQRSHSEWDSGENFNYAMLTPEGDLVGCCGLMSRQGPGCLEIGYWVHTGHAGNGYATAAVLALTEAGFGLPEIDRIEIHHDVDNPASGRVAAKAGFQEVGPVQADKKAPGDSGTHLVWACCRRT
jgi:RimJ/RimL family protein N-acetyltransferase